MEGRKEHHEEGDKEETKEQKDRRKENSDKGRRGRIFLQLFQIECRL